LSRPIIAIVGRPNVGKSTLFNRLVGRRQAIVRDVPGVTRDRLYGQVAFERWQATVVDTGGFDPSSVEPLIEGVRRQVLTALDEADLVLFVLDARSSSSPTRWTSAAWTARWLISTSSASANRYRSRPSTAAAWRRCWRSSASAPRVTRAWSRRTTPCISP
jgi:tRNA U34 5-carboxymethylaminomethyl modifying GTPase MnmE/TrmE